MPDYTIARNRKGLFMKKVIIVGAGAQGNVISGILAKAPEEKNTISRLRSI
jgi:hypothetical protein